VENVELLFERIANAVASAFDLSLSGEYPNGLVWQGLPITSPDNPDFPGADAYRLVLRRPNKSTNDSLSLHAAYLPPAYATDGYYWSFDLDPPLEGHAELQFNFVGALGESALYTLAIVSKHLTPASL
jgi:hypothetical protein